MPEQWKPIPGYEGLYEVSDEGKVRSLNRVVTVKRGGSPGFSMQLQGKELICDTNPEGYKTAHLSKKGKVKTIKVARLVLQAFIGPCPEGMETRHKDGNNQNDSLKNLTWGTHLENMRDRYMHGTYLTGEKHCRAKLNDFQVRIIRRLTENKLRAGAVGGRILSYREIADIFGVSESCIGMIKNQESRVNG